MAIPRTISVFSVLAVICGSIGVFIYLVNYSVSVQAVPEYKAPDLISLATTTREYDNESQASVWVASSTLLRQFFGGNDATSTLSVAQEKSTLLKFRAPGGTIYSYVARTPATRERGLSGRESLDVDEGMLFIFPHAGDYAFWMKDMDFSIDMVWISTDRRVVGVTENLSPKTYPKTFGPPANVQFVLEVPAGSAKKFGLKTGSIVSF